jgi:hypothetical protein
VEEAESKVLAEITRHIHGEQAQEFRRHVGEFRSRTGRRPRS